MYVHGHHQRRRSDTAAAVIGSDTSPPTQAISSAPPVDNVPPGIRPDVHERFLAVVARACTRADEELPPDIFDLDAGDEESSDARTNDSDSAALRLTPGRRPGGVSPTFDHTSSRVAKQRT